MEKESDRMILKYDDSYPKPVIEYYRDYFKQFKNIPECFPQNIFEGLMKDLPWERRTDAPRYEYWCNDFGRSYTYGRGAGERTYEAKEIPIAVNSVRACLLLSHNVWFEGCFLNRYDNNRDSLGWHADDDPGIDHSKPIAVVTLGQQRLIKIKHKTDPNLKYQIMLEHGSLLLMLPGMQQDWLHSIPKAGFEAKPRISLTYRGLLK